MKPRHLHRSLYQLQFTFETVSGGDGNAEHAQPAGGPQRRIALFPVSTTDWIDHQLNTAAVSQLLQDRKPVLIAIIDCVIQAAPPQELVLSRTRGAEGRRANFLCDIERGDTYAAARMYESEPRRSVATNPSRKAAHRQS